jgi:hypothetical protein
MPSSFRLLDSTTERAARQDLGEPRALAAHITSRSITNAVGVRETIVGDRVELLVHAAVKRPASTLTMRRQAEIALEPSIASAR